MNAVIKYPGAKWALANEIISLMPKHHSYVEPFAGSLAVLLNKPPSNIETANDLDGDVVNLHTVIRDRPEELAWMIHSTPYAREEYENALFPSDNPIERARRFLVKLGQGYGFRTCDKKAGWKNDVQGRERAYAVRYWNQLPDWIMDVTWRLKQVQIENRPAVELIKRFNYENVLIYADPPYLLSTRKGGKMYKHEMTESDHMELLSALLDHKGTVMLSGYDNDLYNEYLKRWNKMHFKAQAQNATARTETLWMNFDYQLRF